MAAPTAEPSAAVSAEQLADADAKFKQALQLRDSDLEAAVELLGQVLETRNKAYGENAPECAETYLYYGQCLFEQAQAASDFFGDQVKSAANQRAKAIAAAEQGGGDADADAEEEAADGDGDAAPMDVAPPAEPSSTATEAAPAATEATTDAAAEAGSDKAAAEGPTAAAAAAAEGQSGDDAEGAEDEDGSSSSSSGDDDDDDDGEDVGEEDEEAAAAAGAEEGKAEGEEAPQQAPEVTGESDDMALAWEMLELSRLIYNNHGGPDAHANKLADCHLYIGDILAEQEKFEAAAEEYKTAQEMLARLEGGHDAHRRRAAELEFKKAGVLEALDFPAEALAAMQAAKAHLAAHLAVVNGDIAKAGSSGADVAGAVASAAFASILGGYSAPAPAAPSATAAASEEEKKQELARLHQTAADLKGTIESIDDRIEELSASVQEHATMKEQLANLFKSVAPAAAAGDDGGDGGSGGEQQPAAAGGVVETIGFGAASSSRAAAAAAGAGAAVQDIGVIGKGKRVAPTPVVAAPVVSGSTAKEEAPAAVAVASPAAATAAAEADEAAAVGGKKRALSDLTSSDQEPGGDAAAGASDAAAAKVAPAAAAGAAADQPDAVPKRARV